MPAPRRRRRGRGWMAAMMAAALGGSAVRADVPVPAGLEAMLDVHCVACHRGAKAKGGFDLGTVVAEGAAAEDVLRAVRRRLAKQDMPPADELDRPSVEEYAAAVGAIDAVVEPAWREVPAVRRLNRAQWWRSVRDALGPEVLDGVDPDEWLPADEVGEGFDTTADTLAMPPLVVEKYLDAAERVAERAVTLPTQSRVRRVAPGQLRRQGSGRTDGEWAWLSTGGTLSARATIGDAAEYAVEVRVAAQQAGPDVARMAIEVDGRRVATHDVPQGVDAPATVRWSGRLDAGERRVSVRFLNDYWNPKHPDPAQRDRNLAVGSITIEGPFGPVADPPFERRAREWAGEGPVRSRLERVAGAIGEQVFRRPIAAEDARALATTAVAASRGEDGTDAAGWEPALRALVTAMLVDPRFLLRVEPACAPGTAGACALPAWTLAERLSYFLWSSAPDAALRAAANDDRLLDEAAIRAEVARMLLDPRASALAERFAVQWLGIDRLESRQLDRLAYPDVDPALLAMMREETERLVSRVVRGELPIRALLDGRTTQVTPRLARHYGFAEAAPADDGWASVQLPEGRPGGVLAHGSVLVATSNPTRTSPVKRGKWVLEALLDAAPPPPPPGVPTLPEAPLDRANRSMRELMQMHRADPDCAVCHVRMDAIGLAFERWDADGRRRETVDGLPVTDESEMPDGSILRGAAAVAAVVGEGHGFERSLARHLLVFALGRGTADADDALLDRLAREAREHGSFPRLVEGIVTSSAFRSRRPRP